MTAVHCTWAVRQATSHCIHQKKPTPAAPKYYSSVALNHLGIVLDDLHTVEQKVIMRGYVPNSHSDYEFGHRFYFGNENGIEIEVILYN